MAEHFGRDFSETNHGCSASALHSSPDAAIDQKWIQNHKGVTDLLEQAKMGYENAMVPERPDGFLMAISARLTQWDEGPYLPSSTASLLEEGLPEDSRNVIELATLLLSYGADPCDLNLDGLSRLEIAGFEGMGAEFREALDRSGFDVGEVWKETIQRKLIFFYGHRQSTTVDRKDIAPPTSEGLSRRRVVIRETDED
ncbi:MAG: hypothetical protein Q9210_000445 [Variospora velana]